MSVPSELLLNTQNSFQTHAQRGANIVQRGGKRKSRRRGRKKGGIRLGKSGKLEKDAECKVLLWGSQCKSGFICKAKDKKNLPGVKEPYGICVKKETFGETWKRLNKISGGKRKSKRTKRMARKGRKSRKKQRGGRGRTITYSNLDFMANNRLGKMVPHGDAYTNCNTQSGGGFGFTREGAADAATFKGSYPAFQKYEKSKQCGGRKRRRRKSRKKRRKSRKKSRKSRRKRRRSRRRRRRRKRGSGPFGQNPDGTIRQRGGSSASYAAPFAGGEKPWATAPLGIQKNGASCYDNYNHYKGM